VRRARRGTFARSKAYGKAVANAWPAGRIGYVQTWQADAGRAVGEPLGGAEAFVDRIVIAAPGTVHHRSLNRADRQAHVSSPISSWS